MSEVRNHEKWLTDVCSSLRAAIVSLTSIAVPDDVKALGRARL